MFKTWSLDSGSKAFRAEPGEDFKGVAFENQCNITNDQKTLADGGWPKRL